METSLTTLGGLLDRGSIKRSLRRSGRVPLCTRLVITPMQGFKVFRAESETIDVSYHGARIFTNAELDTDMEIRVFQPWRNRFQPARVIWAHNTRLHEYGIELESDEDFWGIQFPADRWHELDPENRPIPRIPEQNASTTPAAAPATQSVVPDLHIDSAVPLAGTSSTRSQKPGEAPLTLEIPASGLEVAVNGITMAGLPFRETGVFFPVASEETVANLWLRTVIRDGARLRLGFPNKYLMTVRVRASFATLNAEGKKNKESIALIELPPGVTVSVNDDEDWV